jgi:serine/threonine protein kinase
VKTLPRLSGDAARRLRHEARAMALVTHPNLATIFGAETWRDTPFLIVEYLEGGTLARRLARSAMSEAEALELCAILADVVHRIHTAGILHRDIKPSNIGFTGDGTPKLLDFGLARLLGEVTSVASGGGGVPRRVERGSRTDSGTATSLVGTPYYLSPEAIAGRPPDPSFDLWSLGVVFYECLTGRRPFEGADQAALFSAVRQSDRGRLRTSLSACSSAVADYACAMLDREGNRRPSSAETVARDLRQLLRPGAHVPGVGATSGTRG